MSTNAKRFGEYVLARRLQLDRNQEEVRAAGGPSDSTLTAIENGRLTDLQRATARKLDKGLRWEAGSARRVWEGGEATPLESLPEITARDLAAARSILGEAEVGDALRSRLYSVIEEEERRWSG